MVLPIIVQPSKTIPVQIASIDVFAVIAAHWFGVGETIPMQTPKFIQDKAIHPQEEITAPKKLKFWYSSGFSISILILPTDIIASISAAKDVAMLYCPKSQATSIVTAGWLNMNKYPLKIKDTATAVFSKERRLKRKLHFLSCASFFCSYSLSISLLSLSSAMWGLSPALAI
jgi:hypothetical protein